MEKKNKKAKKWKKKSGGITEQEKVDSFREEKDNFRGRSKCKREGDIASSSRPFSVSPATRKVSQRKELELLSNELLGMNQ